MTADELTDLVTTALTDTVVPIRTSVTVLDDRVRAQFTVHAETATRVRELEATVASLRERLAVVEMRAPVPGPPGKDGKDGADGFGVEDLSVEFDGDRTILLAFARPGRDTKRFPLTLPFQKYQGPFEAGRTYVQGDTVSLRGCEWHCDAPMTTARPGDGDSGWTLAVKCGRDGRDLRDARAS
jgi:hypothetical protein